MFQLKPETPDLWDSVLPKELRKLSEELARLDILPQDERLMEPFVRRFGRTQGRSGLPLSTYLRLMYLKFRDEMLIEINRLIIVNLREKKVVRGRKIRTMFLIFNLVVLVAPVLAAFDMRVSQVEISAFQEPIPAVMVTRSDKRVLTDIYMVGIAVTNEGSSAANFDSLILSLRTKSELLESSVSANFS